MLPNIGSVFSSVSTFRFVWSPSDAFRRLYHESNFSWLDFWFCLLLSLTSFRSHIKVSGRLRCYKFSVWYISILMMAWRFYWCNWWFLISSELSFLYLPHFKRLWAPGDVPTSVFLLFVSILLLLVQL